MSRIRIEAFLEKEIGLSADAVGPDVVSRAVRTRMADLGLLDVVLYHKILTTSEKEQASLIEAVVVPETWFFRNKKAFRFLADYITGTWVKENPGRSLRVLSIPCATGEEAYSIAMCLVDAGIREDRFHIDGLDISETALIKARQGLYSTASFRGDDLSFRERHFDPEDDGFRLHERLRRTVRFLRGNILDDQMLLYQEPYHVIFCRNLLIYLSPRAKTRTLETIDRLLSDSGILFLGHAEREVAVSWGLVGIPEPGAFACRKERRKAARPPYSAHRSHPRRRRFERVGKGLESAPSVAPAAPAGRDTGSAVPELSPDRKEVSDMGKNLFDQAQALADRGSLTAALDLCRSFIRDQPVHAGAYFLMGLIYETLDKEEEAEASFNKAIYLDPNYSEALNHLSFIFENRGDASGAAHLRERARRAFQQEARG